MPDEAPKPATYVERMETSTKSMHSSMQWVVGAFAAVGAVAFAGLQLSDLGALDPADAPGRFIAAILGVTLVFGGVAAAIAQAGLFFRREPLTIPQLIDNGGDVLDNIDSDSTILGTFCSVKGLKRDYDEALRTLWHSKDEEKQAEAKADADAMLDIMRNVAARGNALMTSARYRQTMVHMSVAVIAAVFGGALFAWGANPPDGVTVELPTVVRPLTPVTVEITTDDGDRLNELHDTLGPKCDLGSLTGVALEQTGSESFRIAIEASDDCSAEVLNVTAQDGQVSTETETTQTTVFVPDPPDSNAPAD